MHEYKDGSGFAAPGSESGFLKLFLLCVCKINIESVLPKDELAPKFYRIFYLTQNSNGVRKLNLASNVSTHSTHSKLARCKTGRQNEFSRAIRTHAD